MSIVERLLFRLRTGADIRIIDEPVDEVVIQYKDFYFAVLIDVATGKPTGDFSWSKDPTMFTTPLREIKEIK